MEETKAVTGLVPFTLDEFYVETCGCDSASGPFCMAAAIVEETC